MGIIIAILSCALIFSLYLLNSNRKKIFQLDEKILNQDNEIAELRKTLNKHENLLRRLSRDENNRLNSPDDKRFIKVIFNPDAQKSYDYFLGNNPDVKVGDFVEVYVSDKNVENLLGL